MVHELKSWIRFFEKVIAGEKTFEIRINDRNFQVGDVLHLREYNEVTKEYTGNEAKFTVPYGGKLMYNPQTAFQEDLRALLNRYSKENESNTPDYVLAQFMIQVLDAFNRATNARTPAYPPMQLPKNVVGNKVSS